jgi:hypothetical protein
MNYYSRCFSVLPLLFLSANLLPGQFTNVLTSRNNTWRDGLNSTETILNQAAIKKNSFGKVCSTAPGAIDGQIFAQPLVVTGTITGYNHVVYVETMADTLYLIDGDSPDCAVIKQISLLQPQEEAVQCADVGSGMCSAFKSTIGILGTPVIDIATNTIYLVTWTKSTAGTCPISNAHSCFVHRLHAMDITTGAEKYNGPFTFPSVTIGISKFTSFNHLQRPGLLLLPNIESNRDSAVYVAFSSMVGSGELAKSIPNGWLFSVDAYDLSAAERMVAWTTTPSGEGGGIWMSGAGLAAGVDKKGGNQHIYVSTGDGTFDAEIGGANYGDSFVELTTNLTVAGYFTPYRQYCDDIADLDLGSGGVMLIANGAGSSTLDFALANGKDGNLYVLDRSDPGGYAGPAGNICLTPAGLDWNHETVAASTKLFYSTPAYWHGNVYSVANNSPLQKYTIGKNCAPGPLCQIAKANSSFNFGYGPAPVVSSNGNTRGTAIVWSLNGTGPSTATAVLRAFDAEHVAASNTLPELWNSKQCPARDRPGNASKFAVPTVANGRVFVGTRDPTDTAKSRGQLDIFGAVTTACK